MGVNATAKAVVGADLLPPASIAVSIARPRQVRQARPPRRCESGCMKIEGTAKLVRIFLGESDRWKGQPLYVAVVEEMRRAGLAGATVFKGILGFGAHSVVHAARIVDLSSDLPIVIELVDSEEKIAAFLPTLDAMVGEGLVTIEKVDVIAYKAGSAPK